jgi:diaminohydroxyphosphoribosylaminopyrimidine deaminase / 5-amino-6-(5-phosphoribosylamino)uracil reductase
MKEEQYMDMALALARRGLGTTSPNPMVGAVLVKGKQVIGKGYHKKAGLPHAEIEALNATKDDPAGSTLFVTLEPCSHVGKTTPCVNAIIKAGIRRVVVAMEDPNPLVNGKGVEALRKAGIEVKVGIRSEEAARLNEAFITYMEKKRPFFIAKAALSLDGKIATRTFDSKWISNEDSRAHANRLRSLVDGVMVGINTVVSDNPFLIPRIPRPRKYPVRIILDSKLRIPLSCEIVKTAGTYRTWIFTNEKSPLEKETRLRAFGVDVIRVGGAEHGRVSLRQVSDELFRREIVSVLVEGGGEIHSAFLNEELTDKVILFYAPILIGGKNALSLVGGKGVEFLKDAHRVRISALKRFRDDIYVEGYVYRDR